MKVKHRGGPHNRGCKLTPDPVSCPRREALATRLIAWHHAGMSKKSLLAVLGPGMLVAATGVGAGDLATAAFAGNALGVAVLWAALLGAFFKFVVNEGIARWQLVTGRTFLEGCMAHLGRPFHVLFLLYLVCWSFFVGSALMAACGVTLHAMVPLFDDPATAKVWFGLLHSVAGVGLVWLGGFRLFERLMAVCIGVMFVTVVITAVRLAPEWNAVVAGLALPRIPHATAGGLAWTVALIGGIGGTLTVLCYGYWIREQGRDGADSIRVTRIDLGAGYLMTAVFGIGMVIIGSRTVVGGSGAGLLVALAESLRTALGPEAKWAFLVGAWGAVFSSLLGVWQSVPYVFADYCAILFRDEAEAHRRRVAADSWWYRGYLLLLASVPALALGLDFSRIQKYYAVFGAFFVPFLAVALLYLNGRSRWLGAHRNGMITNLLLLAVLAFFAYVLISGAAQQTGG